MELRTKGRLQYYGGWTIEAIGWLGVAASFVAAPYTSGISLGGLLIATPLVVSGHIIQAKGRKNIQLAAMELPKAPPPNRDPKILYDHRTGGEEELSKLQQCYNLWTTKRFLAKNGNKTKDFYTRPKVAVADDSTQNVFRQ
jgi:hypothetical protein